MVEPWDVDHLQDVAPEGNLRTGELTKIIDEHLLSTLKPELRTYLGASSIGHPCERKIWYGYKGIAGVPNEPLMQRTFDIGYHLEGMVIEYLLMAGLDIDHDDLSHLRFEDPDIPELQGHCDAIIYFGNDHTLPAILEIKTARDSSFNVFVKAGLKKWYPVYYAQVQCYMGMSGIHEAYVLAINKDTSKLHDEYVAFDASFYEGLKDKALRILCYQEPPPKINNNPCYFTCRMCSYRTICHG